MFNRLIYEREPEVYDRDDSGFYDELISGEDAEDDVSSLIKLGWTKEKAQAFIKNSADLGL